MLTPSDRLRLLLIAHARAEPYQTAADVMTTAEAFAIWVETRRFPEEVVTDRCKGSHKPLSDQSHP